ncbi:hypothetical protein SDC9_98485 [bioreactor metagenome]|uniref:Uncharacterized protein n=1 Tax=bioreactor metagenome TaxID=1076179 RepID=A0A645AQ61_9ZZZZ
MKFRLRQSDVRAFRLHVHGQRNHHRTLAPGEHLIKAPLHDPRQLTCRLGAPRALNQRLQRADEVGILIPLDLLQNADAFHLHVRVAGNLEYRAGIDIRRCKADGRVQRAGADGGKYRQRFPLDAEVPVRHMHGGLLVLDLNVFGVSRRDGFPQRVEKAEDAVAGDAEHIGHMLALEIFHDDLTAREFHNRSSRKVRLYDAGLQRAVPGADVLLFKRFLVEPARGDDLRFRVEPQAVLAEHVQVAKERLLMPTEREHARGNRDADVDADHAAVRAL